MKLKLNFKKRLTEWTKIGGVDSGGERQKDTVSIEQDGQTLSWIKTYGPILKFPDNITKIPSGTISYNNKNAYKVILPKSLKSIGAQCFSNFKNIQSIDLPDGVTSVGKYCFYGCEKLKSAVLSKKIKTLNSHVFSYCESLTKVNLPENLVKINEYAFSCCYSLAEISIPHKVTSIESMAFYNCNKLTKVYLPKSLVALSNSAFNATNLSDIYYEGSEDEWTALNYTVNTAKVHFNYKY